MRPSGTTQGLLALGLAALVFAGLFWWIYFKPRWDAQRVAELSTTESADVDLSHAQEQLVDSDAEAEPPKEVEPTLVEITERLDESLRETVAAHWISRYREDCLALWAGFRTAVGDVERLEHKGPSRELEEAAKKAWDYANRLGAGRFFLSEGLNAAEEVEMQSQWDSKFEAFMDVLMGIRLRAAAWRR